MYNLVFEYSSANRMQGFGCRWSYEIMSYALERKMGKGLSVQWNHDRGTAIVADSP